MLAKAKIELGNNYISFKDIPAKQTIRCGGEKSWKYDAQLRIFYVEVSGNVIQLCLECVIYLLDCTLAYACLTRVTQAPSSSV